VTDTGSGREQARQFFIRGVPRNFGEMMMFNRLTNTMVAVAAVLGLAVNVPVGAALPTPVAPSTAPAAGDWIALIQGYIKDAGLVLGLAIAVLGFLWVAYLAFAKFNEARMGKAEWAEVGVLGVVGAVVLIFASFLLTEAAGVI
jgi:integrating conjugative element membrane protein (TIGR03745 family)